MAKRSVAVYVPSLNAGGAERTAAVLASGFHAAGLSTTLLADLPGGENRALVPAGVEIVTLGGGHARDAWRLARWLRACRPDVALAVDATANLKLTTAALIARVPTRVVLSYHGYAEIVRGHLGRAGYRLAGPLARRAQATVCVSEGLSRHLVGTWGAPADRVATIPNPIPVECARPAADVAALAARPPGILAVGRLVPEKCFDTLIAALARLPDATRLTILGEGPERGRLEAAAAAAGLAERVSLPGYRPPWEAYSAARVLALVSRSESFGNVVAEALAAGLPVVATDCGGPREILEDGRHGALVPVGDVAALADALAAALAAPGDPAPRIARAATYATPRVVARYLDLFDRIAAERAAA